MSGQLTTFGDGRDINEDNEEIPEWARPYIRNLKAQVTDLTKQLDNAFVRGVESVMAIRCTKHMGVPQLNTEAGGGECAACVVENAVAASSGDDTPRALLALALALLVLGACLT